MSKEINSLTCVLCKKGDMSRNHVCDEYVVWICNNGDCPQQDLESFYNLDDEGWEWLREFYKK